MPGIVLFSGPQPPPDAPFGFCMVCAATAKHAAYQQLRAQVQDHEKRGSGPQRWDLDITSGLEPAVAWGLYPPLGVSGPLCWSHIVMVDLRASAILPGTAQQGAVLLDQARPQQDGR